MSRKSLTKGLKKKIRENYRLYCILSMIAGKDSSLHRYVEACCSGSRPVIMIEGDNLDSDIFYKISYGENEVCLMGLFAIIAQSTKKLYFAEAFGLKPIVIWGEKLFYYDPTNKETQNVFEYYYLPINVNKSKIYEKDYRYVESKHIDMKIFDKDHTGYGLTEQTYIRLAQMYRKYFRLNEKTRNYLENNIGVLLGQRKHVLGVHLRGTDFKRQYNNHPSFVGFQHHVELTRRLMEKYHFEAIFVATDDLEALELMQREFGDSVLYYKDCNRGSGDVGVHHSSNRDKGGYVLGLEVLRDAYTLSVCEALVCGLSQVSSAARYIKMAVGGDFIEIAQIPQSINHNMNEHELDFR